jgi:hypothetical protein
MAQNTPFVGRNRHDRKNALRIAGLGLPWSQVGNVQLLPQELPVQNLLENPATRVVKAAQA